MDRVYAIKMEGRYVSSHTTNNAGKKKKVYETVSKEDQQKQPNSTAAKSNNLMNKKCIKVAFLLMVFVAITIGTAALIIGFTHQSNVSDKNKEKYQEMKIMLNNFTVHYQSMKTKLYSIEKHFYNFSKNTIPRSCDDITGAEIQSGNYVISPDPARVKPFVVYCKFSSAKPTETILRHDSTTEVAVTKCATARCYNRNVTYYVQMAQIVALINITSNCSQFIKYRCLGSVITHQGSSYAAWYSRDGKRQFYWGGATSRRNGYCACGETGTCVDPQYKCNCDRNSAPETFDEGYLTNKSKLPVTQLQFGDTDDSSEGGWHTLGPLVCVG